MDINHQVLVKYLTKLIKRGSNTSLAEIHKLINSIWHKEVLPDQWKDSLIVPFVKRAVKRTVVITEGYHRYQLRMKFYTILFSQGYLHV
jgi:hypothetical protein